MLNKPRVFLSHSKKDEKFVGRLRDDLRKCQVDPWMDTEEIRDGKSWLKVIFEDGIPTCDVVIVYFTEASITSKMVGKEVDAALIEQLSEKGIAFLPYVETANLRAKLRADIRALQCRVWNDQNYSDMLPSVVAEIWHSHMERILQVAVLQEKTRRLELEIEAARLRERNLDHIFLPSEDKDFGNIYKQLNTNVDISYDLWEKKKDDTGTGKRIGEELFRFNLLEALIGYVRKGYNALDHWRFMFHPIDFLKPRGYPKAEGAETVRHYGNGKMQVDYLVTLRTFGLTKRVQFSDGSGRTKNQEEFTEKMYRFLYWVQYNNYEPTELTFVYIGLQAGNGDHS